MRDAGPERPLLCPRANVIVAALARSRQLGESQGVRASIVAIQWKETPMPVVDADCHVVESPRTWSYMEEGDGRYRPAAGRELPLAQHGSHK